MIVKISDIIDALDMPDEMRSFLNLETGEIISIAEEEMREVEKADDLDDFEDVSEWERDILEQAFDIIENEDEFVELPSQYEVNEYSIMEDFCFTLSDEAIKDDILYGIHGNGAFKRFKNKIHKYELQERWYRFREESFREIAIEWCELNGIEYEED